MPAIDALIPRRARILRAAVDVIAQRGFAGASVAAVIERAGVARASFHAEFDDLDGCVGVVLDETLAHTLALVSDAFENAECWRDGLRRALLAVLVFLEGEPALARVAMVESLAGGAVVLAHREHVVSAFRVAVAARIEGEVPYRWPLAAEGMFASVMGVVHARMSAAEPAPLAGLLAPLMATLVAPFSDAEELEREVSRCERLAADAVSECAGAPLAAAGCWPLAHAPVLPAMLAHPRSRRARDCLLFVSEHPGVSNREIAGGIGVAAASQISRLLSRLAREGLLIKRSEGAGRPNVWRLSDHGRQTLGALQERAS